MSEIQQQKGFLVKQGLIIGASGYLYVDLSAKKTGLLLHQLCVLQATGTE